MKNVMQLFTYLSVLTSLITFVKNAEAAIGSGGGADKKNMVLDAFLTLVTALKNTNLLSASHADALSGAASILIEGVVSVLNSVGLLKGDAEKADAEASAATPATAKS